MTKTNKGERTMTSLAAEHADAAAEAIRALNHATLPAAGGLSEPADAYEVFACLASLADRLRQSLTQVQHFLEEQHAAGAIRIVDGPHRGHPGAAVDTCRAWTHTAAANAGALAHALHDAQHVLTWAAASGGEREPDALSGAHDQSLDPR
jgi:hypothetical protein